MHAYHMLELPFVYLYTLSFIIHMNSLRVFLSLICPWHHACPLCPTDFIADIAALLSALSIPIAALACLALISGRTCKT